jgi:hypothetical protein
VASRPELDKYRWQKLRARAKARDGNRCRRCGARVKLQVHHVVKPQDGGTDTLENLITLCDRCHRLTHKLAAANRRQGFPDRGVVQANKDSPTRAGVEYPSPIPSPSDELPEDDPDRGIFWGPPQIDGTPRRWSRPWFDWRNDPEVTGMGQSAPLQGFALAGVRADQCDDQKKRGGNQQVDSATRDEANDSMGTRGGPNFLQQPEFVGSN